VATAVILAELQGAVNAAIARLAKALAINTCTAAIALLRASLGLALDSLPAIFACASIVNALAVTAAPTSWAASNTTVSTFPSLLANASTVNTTAMIAAFIWAHHCGALRPSPAVVTVANRVNAFTVGTSVFTTVLKGAVITYPALLAFAATTIFCTLAGAVTVAVCISVADALGAIKTCPSRLAIALAR